MVVVVLEKYNWLNLNFLIDFENVFILGNGFHGDGPTSLSSSSSSCNNWQLESVNEDNNSKNYFKSQHREGKFIGLIKLLSTENDNLHHHLINCKTGQRKTTFLSHIFIGKVLEITSQYLIKLIVNEINKINVKIFGISVDTTTDITSIHQGSTVVRYVSDDNEIIERTIAFHEFANATGQGIYKVLSEALKKLV